MKAWRTFLLATAVNGALVGGLVTYSRTLYLDAVIERLGEPGMTDLKDQEVLLDRREHSVDRLGRAFADPERSILLRQRVAVILGKTRDLRALPYLAGQTSAGEWEIRQAAADGLAELQRPEAYPALEPLLADDDRRVRVRAVAALRSFAFETSRPHLEAALEDPDDEVRAMAGQVLRVHFADRRQEGR